MLYAISGDEHIFSLSGKSRASDDAMGKQEENGAQSNHKLLFKKKQDTRLWNERM